MTVNLILSLGQRSAKSYLLTWASAAGEGGRGPPGFLNMVQI